MEIAVIWIALSIGIGALASSRGHGPFAFFVLSLLLSPLMGLLAVIVAGESDRRQRERIFREEELRRYARQVLEDENARI